MPRPLHPLPVNATADKPNPSYDDLLQTVRYLMKKRRAVGQQVQHLHRRIHEIRHHVRHLTHLNQEEYVQQGKQATEDCFHSLAKQQHSSFADAHNRNLRNPNYDELLATIQHLINDCRGLSEQRTLVERTVEELTQQARHAEASLTARRAVGQPSTWIGGHWLAPSQKILGPAESMWQQGKAEDALALIGSVLSHHDLTVEEDVDANLLVSAIKRASGDVAQASKCAEDALVIAYEGDAYVLASKAQFHRGMCFLGQGLYAQARFCFALASHLDGYQEQIEVHYLLVDEMCRNLPLTHPGRRLGLTSI